MLNCKLTMNAKKLIYLIFEFESKGNFLIKCLFSFLIVFKQNFFFIS